MSEIKTELIQDFSGGLNLDDSPNKIEANESPSCLNVWADSKSLSKRNGCTVLASTATIPGTSTAVKFYGAMCKTYSDYNGGTTAANEAIVVFGTLLSPGGSSSCSRVFVYSTNGSTFSVMTVGGKQSAVDASGTTITSNGAPDFTANYCVGDYIYLYASNEIYLITAIGSSTSMTVSPGIVTTETASDYAVFPSFSKLGGTLQTSVAFSEMNKFLWVCGDGRTPFKWNGSTAPFVSAFPLACYSTVYQNYLFAMGTTANPSRVFWSSVLDPTSWPASNFVDVKPDDGCPIVGCFLDGQSIVILKTNSAWRLTGSIFDPSNPTYTLTQISTPANFRMNSARSVKMFQGGYLMLGLAGFYVYNGSTIEWVPQSRNIKTAINAFYAQSFALNSLTTFVNEPTALVINGNYWVSLKSSRNVTTNGQTTMYVVDRFGKYWEWSRSNSGVVDTISDFAYWRGIYYGVSIGALISSSQTDTAGLHTLDTGSSEALSSDSAIYSNWSSKVFEYDNQQLFMTAEVYFKKQSAGNLTFSYQIDEGGYTDVTIDMTAPATGSTRGKSQIITLGQVGSSIQFKLTQNVSAQTFEVYGIKFVRRPLSV